MNDLGLLLAGGACGLGGYLAARSVRTSPLHDDVARLAGAGARIPVGIEAGSGAGGVRSATALDRLGRLGPASRDTDLAVAGRTSHQHAVAALSMALVLAGSTAAALVLAGRAGWVVAPLTGLVLVVVALGVGWLWTGAQLKATARRRRRDFSHALSSYLDLVNVLLAGGAGTETALQAAADAGDGWAFAAIRDVLLRARTTRRSVWVGLAELGTRFGVDDLAELSASVQLAGEHGARVASSLSARANAMRDRLQAQIEADAHAASERMGLPTVLMFVGFLFLLGYPAVRIIVGAS